MQILISDWWKANMNTFARLFKVWTDECYLHRVIMNSICGQRFHQGQISTAREEQVNRNLATYTSSLSPDICTATDRRGFKIQPLRGRSHLQWQADRFALGAVTEGGESPLISSRTEIIWSQGKHDGGLPCFPRLGRLPTIEAALLINDTVWHADSHFF